MDTKNFKINIKYDGTNYCGWQTQPNAPTVQEKIEQALTKLTGQQTRAHAAGRTDTGVHALGQTAHFKINTRLNAYDIQKALNGTLPKDIIITSSEECHPDFHSRYSAIGKHYSYIIKQGAFPSLLYRNFSHHIRHHLSIDQMERASAFFIGSHNFKPFCANSGRENENFQRYIIDIKIQTDSEFVYIHVLGKSFLYKMVRYMVGTLIKIGYGNRTPETINNIFSNPSKYSKLAGPVAPAKGLFLTKVFYKPPLEITPFDKNCNFF